MLQKTQICTHIDINVNLVHIQILYKYLKLYNMLKIQKVKGFKWLFK